MYSLKDTNRNFSRWFVIAFIYPALLLMTVSDGYAQTLTATPDSVDAAKPQQVVLRVTKADGSSDTALIDQVQSVKVGNQTSKIQSKEADSITIIPPPLTSNTTQPVQLFNNADKVIAEGQLLYHSGGSGSATQDIALRRAEHEEKRRENLVGYNWYYALVTLMFLAVLVPFVLAIYRGTSGSRATDNRPLGLPIGSFRSILAYSLVAYLGFYVLTSVLSVSYFEPPEFLLGIVATVIGFYFGSRSGDEGEASMKTGTVHGIVRQGTNPARGAVVKFKRSADDTEPYSRITDLDGRFELRGVKPSKYKVQASLTGSAPSDEQEISVAEGSDHEIEISIKSTATSQTPPPAQTASGQ